MSDAVLVINAGSSSLKFELFSAPQVRSLASGSVEELNGEASFKSGEHRHSWPKGQPPKHAGAIAYVLDFLQQHHRDARLVGVGHRVVHGGTAYSAPVMVNDEVLRQLQAYVPLAPLHQPHNLRGIAAVAERFPSLPQVACFDTAFHRAQSETEQRYAIPRALHDEGIRRYGFHGLSYEFIATDARAAKGRVVVAHLGNGSSMCGLVDGKSVASTMGFTALDGLPMGTRCGALDPGVLLYLLGEKKLELRQLETLLYKESGLLGVSGLSSDMRTLLESNETAAREAIDVYCHRIVRELGSLAAALGGLDALVFTAGIGENAAPIRDRVCRAAGWLGLDFDAAANASKQQHISTPSSRVKAYVIPTDEELMVARHAIALIQPG